MVRQRQAATLMQIKQLAFEQADGNSGRVVSIKTRAGFRR
jgi:hypothetical protein